MWQQLVSSCVWWTSSMLLCPLCDCDIGKEIIIANELVQETPVLSIAVPLSKFLLMLCFPHFDNSKTIGNDWLSEFVILTNSSKVQHVYILQRMCVLMKGQWHFRIACRMLLFSCTMRTLSGMSSTGYLFWIRMYIWNKTGQATQGDDRVLQPVANQRYAHYWCNWYSSSDLCLELNHLKINVAVRVIGLSGKSWRNEKLKWDPAVDC